MKIDSDRFGPMEVPDTDILHLPAGLLGFPDLTRVTVLEHRPGSPFRWLLSVDDASVAFVVVDPLTFVPDYPVDDLRRRLVDGGEIPTQIAVAAITTVLAEGRSLSVNLMAPVVFDLETRRGRQIVLHDKGYGPRHAIDLAGA